MKNNCIVILLLLSSLFSCKATKEIKVEKKDLDHITERRLFRNIAINELDYNTLYAKKMSVSFTSGKKSNNFKAIMQVQQDSFIWISVTAPLGIEVARLLMTPDSIKFINVHEKNYLLTDYSYFEEKWGIELGFDCIQRMLSNQFFNFASCTSQENKNKHYKFSREENNYLLYTYENRALGRKIKKLHKKKRKNKEFSLVLEKIAIDPYYFRPSVVSIEDVEEKMGMNVNYLDFKDFEGKLFPEKILFKIFTSTETIQLEIVYNRLEFNVPVKPTFKISTKYKPIDP